VSGIIFKMIEVGSSDVRINFLRRMTASGICHTDATVAKGLLPGAAFPVILGEDVQYQPKSVANLGKTELTMQFTCMQTRTRRKRSVSEAFVLHSLVIAQLYFAFGRYDSVLRVGRSVTGV
jgi:hypothetical protein